MKVMMTGFARQQFRKTAKYINGKFGKKSRDNFLQQVQRTKQLLGDNPYIGPEEPLLTDGSTSYRSVVVNHLNKMVYRILNDYIEIADFWDCRREPESQAEQTRSKN
ncbi:MAG: type II toxin-antitoxin system RelE/ParE family toxin [Bacteroidales bacterium]|nr:type II toxin-antitoxin system RelE/ParE family toxin [Bacteroidales bacterium]